MVDNSNQETGWDLQIGYELQQSGLGTGLQLQMTEGQTSNATNPDDMHYSSTGLYLTARPGNSWFHAKAGVVQSNVRTLAGNVDSSGYGAGFGLVAASRGLTVHLLDYQRLVFDNASFNQYTFSIALLF